MINSTTVQRLWNKRDKQGTGTLHTKGKSSSVGVAVSENSSAIYYGLFSTSDKVADAQEEQKIKILRRCIREARSIALPDSPILFALHSRYALGDIDKAYELLLTGADSWQASLTEYRPTVRLLGAENRSAVTCYLDSILFAMFARLDSFEAMLQNIFKDDARNRLAMVLRLWVSLLRSGKLITTDITQVLQETLAECGWKEAAELRQQDASEAFTFITEKLELPLLTLKMDIYHTGREDAKDDHKLINERLLEVAIPEDLLQSEAPIPLEDCLEAYFNNRIEVKRYLGLRSTLQSSRLGDTSDPIPEKGAAIHIESVDIDVGDHAGIPATPISPIVNSSGSQRSSSIVQQRFIPDESGSGDPPAYESEVKRPTSRLRSGSLRKEVMMPAWQFFSLIPWYTNNTPKDDAQVAAHFSSKRPILGMCLKRYSFTDAGKAVRQNIRIDIPTEIGLPHFISDDRLNEGGSIYGNFKLLLQSVVCHRGASVDSGHYVSLVRASNATVATKDGSPNNNGPAFHQWMKFDDLAAERVVSIDIHQALRDETPYLLFYQIVPIDSDPERPSDGESLPLYAPLDSHDSGVGEPFLEGRGSSDDMAIERRSSVENAIGGDILRGRSPNREQNGFGAVLDEPAGFEEPMAAELPSSQLPSRRGSASGRKDSPRRSQSQTSEMFSKSFSRLTSRKSKESAPRLGNSADADADVLVGDGREGLAVEDDRVKGFFRKDKKSEKNKNRLSMVAGMSGKGRGGEKPDRECSVM